MPSFRLTLEYDGADFEGWQAQPEGHRTVQGTLEDAVAQVTGERVRATGSGRTDTGVHAEAQVASLQLASEHAADALHKALNGVLPADLSVLALEAVPEGFDARRDATGKLYCYTLWNASAPSPLIRRRALHWRRPLDRAAIEWAAADLVGTHDFSSFRAAGSQVKTSVRSLRRLELTGEVGGQLDFWFEGNGFLRHMVRNLMGTLLEVGSGRRKRESMPALLAARDRSLAGPTAAAHGLTLVRVEYGKRHPEEPDSEENSGA